MSSEEIIKFIKSHPELKNDCKLEEKTITVTISGEYYSDRKFYESLINGFDNYFAITGRYLVIYKDEKEKKQ